MDVIDSFKKFKIDNNNLKINQTTKITNFTRNLNNKNITNSKYSKDSSDNSDNKDNKDNKMDITTTTTTTTISDPKNTVTKNNNIRKNFNKNRLIYMDIDVKQGMCQGVVLKDGKGCKCINKAVYHIKNQFNLCYVHKTQKIAY